MTRRAVIAAVLLIVVSAWIVQKTELVFNGPCLTDHAPPAGPVALLGMILLSGSLLRRHSLSRQECIVVYAMLTVAMPLASTGLVHNWLTGLVTGCYGAFASPTGRYAGYLVAAPSWLFPGGIGSRAAVDAFEGTASGVPWREWLLPLGIWGVGFFLVLFVTVYCLTALFYRQWTDTERVSCPLIELPLSMLAGHCRSRLWWLGAMIPIVVLGVNGLHHYMPQIGPIFASLDLGDFLVDRPWQAMAPFTSPFTLDFSPLTVGIAYLIPLEVSFSTWFFFLVSRIQLLLADVAGLAERQSVFVGKGGEWKEWPPFFPFFSAQAKGGILCLSILTIWSARHRLSSMLTRCDGATAHDDSPDPLSPRTAVLGLAAGSAILLGWSCLIGLHPGWALFHLAVFYLLLIGVTRLRVEAGVPFTGLPFIVASFIFILTGTGPLAFGRGEYVAFAMLAVTSYTCLGGAMILQCEALRAAESVGLRAGMMGKALVLAFIVGLASAIYFGLTVIYDQGIFALDTQGGATGAARVGRYYHYLYSTAGDEAAPTDWLRIAFHAVGFAVTWGLVALGRVFIRWPFHPVGYIVGTGFGRLFWSGFLIGWVIKAIVLHYGSSSFYRTARPFFLGMIFGDLAMRSLWAAVSLAGQMGGGYRVGD